MLARTTSRTCGRVIAAMAGALGTGLVASVVEAAEIKVLSASALKIIVTELAEQFQKESGHTLKLGAGLFERGRFRWRTHARLAGCALSVTFQRCGSWCSR